MVLKEKISTRSDHFLYNVHMLFGTLKRLKKKDFWCAGCALPPVANLTQLSLAQYLFHTQVL